MFCFQLQEELDQGIGLSHGSVMLKILLVWTFDFKPRGPDLLITLKNDNLCNFQLQEELDQGIGLSHGGVTLKRLLVWTFDPLIRLKSLAALVDVCKGIVFQIKQLFLCSAWKVTPNFHIFSHICLTKLRGFYEKHQCWSQHSALF